MVIETLLAVLTRQTQHVLCPSLFELEFPGHGLPAVAQLVVEPYAEKQPTKCQSVHLGAAGPTLGVTQPAVGQGPAVGTKPALCEAEVASAEVGPLPARLAPTGPPRQRPTTAEAGGGSGVKSCQVVVGRPWSTLWLQESATPNLALSTGNGWSMSALMMQAIWCAKEIHSGEKM